MRLVLAEARDSTYGCPVTISDFLLSLDHRGSCATNVCPIEKKDCVDINNVLPSDAALIIFPLFNISPDNFQPQLVDQLLLDKEVDWIRVVKLEGQICINLLPKSIQIVE